jgi:hypothetical protein
VRKSLSHALTIDASLNSEECQWSKHFDEFSGYYYYTDLVSGITQWEPPAGFVDEEYGEQGANARTCRAQTETLPLARLVLRGVRFVKGA